MKSNITIKFRKVLLSTGEVTTESVISDGHIEVSESSPTGLTIGSRECARYKYNELLSKSNVMSVKGNLSQKKFDASVSSKFGSEIGVALSFSWLRYLSEVAGFKPQFLFRYIADVYSNKDTGTPKIIANILNGGPHVDNGLAFCEFMIIPKGKTLSENIQIASEIYLDLKSLIASKLGVRHCLVGREGGFAPYINNVESAVSFVADAIRIRNDGKATIAIDVAANSFSEKKSDRVYIYTIDEKVYTTAGLLDYYSQLLAKFPEINYLEDPFNEDDLDGWKALLVRHADLFIVADDLTVSNIRHLKKYRACFNACVLKVNQVGDVSSLLKAYEYCQKRGIKTIISQRSGETDSNIISHLAIGLGSDYVKAGAPARERIIKYNELTRIEDRLKTGAVSSTTCGPRKLLDDVE